jgi:hypothetical protein
MSAFGDRCEISCARITSRFVMNIAPFVVYVVLGVLLSALLPSLARNGLGLYSCAREASVERESGCRKPRDRGLRDVEAPRYIGLRVSVSKALKGF